MAVPRWQGNRLTMLGLTIGEIRQLNGSWVAIADGAIVGDCQSVAEARQAVEDWAASGV